MVSARAMTLVAIGIAWGVLTGCEGIIGLGEEPPLKAPPLKKTAEACRLPPARNPTCTECMVDSCCAQARACMANAACADAAENCLPTCWEGLCAFNACLAPLEGKEHELLRSLILCGAGCQAPCLPTPGGSCETLAQECCATIEGEAARQSCVDAALGGDEEACASFRVQAESSLCPPK